MEDSKVFDEKYAACLSKIKKMEAFKKAEEIGLKKHDQKSVIFDFFNREIVFDGYNFIDTKGDEVSTAIKVVLCNYLLKSPSTIHIASNRLVTIR